MKVLLHSYAYAPSRGGIESSSRLMVRALLNENHLVKIVTATPNSDDETLAEDTTPVLRSPESPLARDWVRWADIIIQNHLSLNLLRPAVLSLKPVYVHLQTWLPYHHSGIRRHLMAMVRQGVLLRCRVSANSRAVAQTIRPRPTIIGNPYDSELFYPFNDPVEKKDFLFVGRLVSDKGADLLIDALGILKKNGISPELTIVGAGPEEVALKQKVEEQSLDGQVQFHGPADGSVLAEQYRKHKILVVPSRWEEPFGIVALEGAACGCAVVGSHGGGLPDAIGPCGSVFPNGDIYALAKLLEKARADPEAIQGPVNSRRQHLENHRPEIFLKRLLKRSE